MADLYSTLISILLLLSTASFMIVFAFVCSSISFSRFILTRKGITPKIIFGVIFGLLAIYGTFMGTKLADGTIVNVRELATMIAGVTGGPLAGMLAGLIGGIHRFSVGEATALPCAISTIVIGVVAGFVSTKLLGKAYLPKVQHLP